MTCLLNGCSYGVAWSSFPGVNLSKAGGSFNRSIRTTMEWIAVNGKPSYVFIPISSCARFELSRIAVDSPIEGAYVTGREHYDILARISDSCYMTWDYMFMNIIMFSSWLEQQDIPYLMWDQCNNFDRIHIREFKAVKKLRWVEENSRVIDLFGFCGNLYMHENGAALLDSKNPTINHYEDKDYSILKAYLDAYIKEKLNEKIDWK